VNDAIEALTPGGRLFCFGVPDEPYYPIALQAAFLKGLGIAGGVVAERRRCLQQADRYLRRYPELHDVYVTNTFSMAEAQTGFEVAARPAQFRE